VFEKGDIEINVKNAKKDVDTYINEFVGVEKEDAEVNVNNAKKDIDSSTNDFVGEKEENPEINVNNVKKNIDTYYVNVKVLDAETADERPVVTCVKLEPDEKLHKYFTYKLNAEIVYKKDGSLILDNAGFYHRYDINSIDMPRKNTPRNLTFRFPPSQLTMSIKRKPNSPQSMFHLTKSN
jgi:hypothetical protein